MEFSELSGGSTVHIDSLSPRVVTNDAGAKIRFVVCTLRSSRSGEGLQSGGIPVLRRSFCSSIVRAQGADLVAAGKPVQELVMLITPTRPGTVHVAGVDLTYSTGWQRGTERIGVDTTIRVPQPGS